MDRLVTYYFSVYAVSLKKNLIIIFVILGMSVLKPDTSVIKAKPVPHTGIPFQPKLPHQHTVPEPFSVETRSKMMLAQKEDKIKQILEEEKRVSYFLLIPTFHFC